jgi:hypothetical protein
MTMNDSFFANLKYWQKLTGEESNRLNVIYGGDIDLGTSNGNYIAWRSLKNIAL